MKPLRRNERSRCAPQVRMAASISASAGARAGAGSGGGFGWLRLDGVEQRRHRLADRVPVRRGVVAGPDQRLLQRLPAGCRRAVRADRSAAAAAAAPDCPARSCRTCRDGGRRRHISARPDRRRHIATGHPSGPSARGRRHRRYGENSWMWFPRRVTRERPSQNPSGSRRSPPRRRRRFRRPRASP